MADLIERSAAIEAADSGCKAWRGIFRDVKAELEQIPAVDAVPVVRCVDCRYCRIWEGRAYAPYMCECRHMNNIRKDALHKADHFCGYGERRKGVR